MNKQTWKYVLDVIDGLLAATVPDNSVTNARLMDVPTQTIKGRLLAGTGDPTDITITELKALLKAYFDTIYATDVGGGNGFTSWTEYTLTIGATTTPPTHGTLAFNKAFYRQCGANTIEMIYNFAQTSGVSNGSGIYLFPLPSGFTVDGSIVPIESDTSITALGFLGSGQGNDGTNQYELHPHAFDSDNLALYVSAFGANLGSTTGLSLGTTTDRLSFYAKVPVNE